MENGMKVSNQCEGVILLASDLLAESVAWNANGLLEVQSSISISKFILVVKVPVILLLTMLTLVVSCKSYICPVAAEVEDESCAIKLQTVCCGD